MRVLYMGTPQFAVPSLKKLAEHFEVIGVVTQPDKPKGRGHKLTPPEVKEAALELGIPVFQPIKIRQPEFLQTISDLKPDIIMVAAYARLIPKALLELPRLGCINLHPSLLPRHRGAIPVPAAIMAGDKVTGISTFIMEEGYDTGPLLLQREVPILPDESGSGLLDRLSLIGADMMVETALGLENGTLVPKPQEGEANYTKPFSREDLIIDWKRSAEEVANFVRALYSEPEAGTSACGQTLKIGAAPVCGEFAAEAASAKPGEVVGSIKGKGFVVATGNGAVVLRLVKPAGKGWMDGAAFAAGRRLTVGSVLGEN